MSDVVRWVCTSPVRLVVVTLALVLVAAGALTAVQTRSGTAPSATGAASSAVEQPDRSDARVPDADPFVTAASEFTRAWAAPAGGQEQWLTRLEGLTTPELAAGLALTDPADLPGTGPAGDPTVRYLAQDSALVVVPLDDGARVLVTVVSERGRWLVSDVQPDVGDHGARS